MARQEGRQQRGNMLAAERSRHSDPQRAGDFGRRFTQPRAQGLQVFHQNPPALCQGHALRRWMQATRGPVQQAHPQFAFQPFQALAGHRHRQVKAARRCRDGTQIQHSQEQGQVTYSIHYQYFIEFN